MKIKYLLLPVSLVGLTVMLSSMVGLGHADKTVDLLTFEKSTIRAWVHGQPQRPAGGLLVLPIQVPSADIIHEVLPGEPDPQDQPALAELDHHGVSGGRKMSLFDTIDRGFYTGDTVEHLGFYFVMALILVFLGYAFFALCDRPRAIRRIRMES